MSADLVMTLLATLALLLFTATDPLPSRVPCAFKWAQSAEHIHIFAKFAHKIDAPSSNDCKKEVVDITARQVRFNSTNGIKRYMFEVELLRELLPKVQSHVYVYLDSHLHHQRKVPTVKIRLASHFS